MNDSLTIQPIGTFQQTVRPPGSKSLTNRALLLAALANGRSRLSNVLFSDDTRVMLDALGQLGFEIDVDETHTTVTIMGSGGTIPAQQADLFLGNAGTATRFLTAAVCLGQGQYRIDGIARMRERPIGQLVDALATLNATITYEGQTGYPPLCIEAHGLSKTQSIPRLPNTMSSQYISAMLQVGPYVRGVEGGGERGEKHGGKRGGECGGGGLKLQLDTPVISAPYVRMTLALMQQFGVKANAADDLSTIQIDQQTYTGVDLLIEPDASNATYFLAAGALVPGSCCTIAGLGTHSIQGDVGFAHVLAQMGASVTMTDESITVAAPAPGEKLRGIDVDLNMMPDTAQTLAAVALFADGPTIIRNVGNLRVKETDRMAALQNELTKLGASVTVVGDDMTINPPKNGAIQPTAIDTYDDHRMAMSFAIVGLLAPGVTINDPSCVNKTYPGYFDDLAKLNESGRSEIGSNS